VAEAAPSPAAPAPAPVVAKKESPPPRTILEEESLFHDEGERDFFDEGKTLVAQGKPGEAIDAFRKSLYSRPQAKTWAALGQAYIATGQVERGASCLEEAIDVEPGRVAARETLVRAYLQTDDGDAARVHAEKLASLDPTSASSQYLLGKTYMKGAMWTQAIASFERSLEIEPANAHAHNNLGYSALMVGKNQLALEHLEAVIDLDPVEPYMMNNLGLAYERAGRAPDALAAYLRATEMKPGYTNAVINRERVRATLTADERELAFEILDELKRDPVPTVTTAAADPTEDAFADPAEDTFGE
jgi:tetratricopeptide (TPR) repeat protein